MTEEQILGWINKAPTLDFGSLEEIASGSGYTVHQDADGAVYLLLTDNVAERTLFRHLKGAGRLTNAAIKQGLLYRVEVAAEKDEEPEVDSLFSLAFLKGVGAQLWTQGLLMDDNEVAEVGRCLVEHHREWQDGSAPMAWHDLVTFYNQDMAIEFDIDGLPVAGIIKAVEGESSPFTGAYIGLSVEVVSLLRHKAVKECVTVKLPAYRDTRTLDQLAAKPLEEPQYEAFAARGQQVLSMVKAAKPYYKHEGMTKRPGFFGLDSQFHQGRMMLDAKTCFTMNTKLFNGLVEGIGLSGRQVGNGGDEFQVEADSLWQVLPLAIGFSLVSKQWSLVQLTDCSAIQFREDAFDKLVMPDERKEMMLAIATARGHQSIDLVDDKGGGAIFLLHGEPGLGKTLSAEAMAEYLKQPLYKVSMGELGTDVSQLETQLEKVLAIATRWDAILLIDEADIFLEARDHHDVQRNAMVAVFLRLLEYYSGILFLTSNRVRNFDPAFHSRITFALRFERMGQEVREKIWRNLLEASGLGDIDIQPLLAYEVNGRQIKNALVGARGLANYRKEPLAAAHIVSMLENCQQFMKDVQPGGEKVTKSINERAQKVA